MVKLNSLQFPNVQELNFDEQITMHPLKNNDFIEEEIKSFSSNFGFTKLKTFKFNKEGVLALMLSLEGKILVSLGESEAIVEAAKSYKDLGFDLEFIPLTKQGDIDYTKISNCDYIFTSSYIMDTYVKTDLEKVKELSKAKLISNISATLEPSISDIVILDVYKLTGYSLDSLVLYNDEFEDSVNSEINTVSIFQIKNVIRNFSKIENYKNEFMETLNSEFNDNIYYFVNPKECLDYTLHFGLKGIKAREIIRTLALDSIYVTNGEGCSLGLSKPSRILQEMGYKEIESRWALSLNFSEELSLEEIQKVVKTISKKYRQIKVLNS